MFYSFLQYLGKIGLKDIKLENIKKTNEHLGN